MERSLEAGPGNYVWFEMVLIDRCIALWKEIGDQALVALHQCFRQPMDDVAVRAELERIHPLAGEIVSRWPAA